MTQEDKELLLKDLLGRVLYGVKVDYHTNIFTLGYNLYLNNSDVAFENYPMLYFLENIDSVKPYLRPMSSMTDEEFLTIYDMCWPKDIEFNSTYGFYWGDFKTKKYIPYFMYNSNQIDYLTSHHFDYRGLIEKGLALEAPEGMYNI